MADSHAETQAAPAPRQVAVALAEAPDSSGPARVVAKGHGKLAEQILNIAFDRGIKVRSDADLAQVLAALDLDSDVPLEALAAVSEILTYVYQANGRLDEEARP